MLETNKDWDSFHRNVDSWTINEDLDEDRPAGVVVARTWDRKQLKGAKALLTRCGTRAHTLGKNALTVDELVSLLKLTFKDVEEGTFGEAYNAFHCLVLLDCKDLDDYNTQFDTKYSRMCEFPEVEVCRPLLVKRYIEGLGPAFQSWLSTFNQTHAILAIGALPGVVVAGVTLAQAQSSAKIEANKMATADLSSAALAARSGRTPAPAAQNGTKRTKQTTHCTVHGWCSHNDTACVTQHPELEAGWRVANPASAVRRDENMRRGGRSFRGNFYQGPQTRASTAATTNPPVQTAAKLAYVSTDENKF